MISSQDKYHPNGTTMGRWFSLLAFSAQTLHKSKRCASTSLLNTSVLKTAYIEYNDILCNLFLNWWKRHGGCGDVDLFFSATVNFQSLRSEDVRTFFTVFHISCKGTLLSPVRCAFCSCSIQPISKISKRTWIVFSAGVSAVSTCFSTG